MSTDLKGNADASHHDGRRIDQFADKDGKFRRPASKFRNFVSADPGAEFPAEKDRYVRFFHHLISYSVGSYRDSKVLTRKVLA